MSNAVQTVGRVAVSEGVSLHYRACPSQDDVAEMPHRPVYMAVKTTMEWLMALALLVVSSPLVLLLALGVKVTSHGPIFYAQTRLGRNGRHYRIFKLRTMVNNAEAKTGPVWAAKNDCRVTKFGKFLRTSHLDEYPQLWNVLRGEMGLIGPRPERPEISARIERDLPEYRARLAVRPGITGLAQMLAPADDPTDPLLRSARRKLALDMHYVEKISFLLDVRILIATVCYFSASAVDSVRNSLLRSHDPENYDAVEMRIGQERAVKEPGTWKTPAETARV